MNLTSLGSVSHPRVTFSFETEQKENFLLSVCVLSPLHLFVLILFLYSAVLSSSSDKCSLPTATLSIVGHIWQQDSLNLNSWPITPYICIPSAFSKTSPVLKLIASLCWLFLFFARLQHQCPLNKTALQFQLCWVTQMKMYLGNFFYFPWAPFSCYPLTGCQTTGCKNHFCPQAIQSVEHKAILFNTFPFILVFIVCLWCWLATCISVHRLWIFPTIFCGRLSALVDPSKNPSTSNEHHYNTI